MAPATRLDQVYRRMMKDHPFGYPLYKPVLMSSMQPGSCGYFDDSGFWHYAFHLNDAQQELVDSNINWEPKLSKGTSKIDTGFSVDPSIIATGFPVGVNAKWKLDTKGHFGAVLVTTPPVHHHRITDDLDLEVWFNQNVLRLLEGPLGSKIKRYGLFVATGTYSTTNCSIASWRDCSNEVFIGCNVGVLGQTAAGVHGGWHLSQNASGRNHYHAPDGDRYVVFVTGLWFKPRQVFSKVFIQVKDDSKMRSWDEIDLEGTSNPANTTESAPEFSCEKFVETDATTGIGVQEEAKWAILIGIDYYKDNSGRIPQLNGCVADVKAMEAYFSEKLGLDSDHILTLTSTAPYRNSPEEPEEPESQRATYQNIVEIIKQVTAMALRKDLVYIHFSGHGATTKQSKTGYALVPMDLMQRAAEKQRAYLSGDEFMGLLNEMRGKELVVTVVLDCCHSGGQVRGDVGLPRGIGDIDAILGDGSEPAPEGDDVPAGWQPEGFDVDSGRGVSTSHHWLESPSGKYTVIAACREFEKAYEVKLRNGKTYGALTYCLLRVLSNEDVLVSGLSRLSYGRLQWHLAPSVHRFLGSTGKQNVLIKGATRRGFFSSKQFDIRSVPVITKLNYPPAVRSSIWLNTSEHLGAKVGSEFIIYPLISADGQKPDADPLACCKVKSVSNGHSEATMTELFTQNHNQLVEGCPAIPKDIEAQKFVRIKKQPATLNAAAEAAALDAVRETWKCCTENYATLVGDSWPGSTHFEVEVNGNSEYQVLDQNGAVILKPRNRLSTTEKTASVTLVSHINHLAKFFIVSQLKPTQPNSSLVKIHVRGNLPRDGNIENEKTRQYGIREPIPDYVKPTNAVIVNNSVNYDPKDLLVVGIENATNRPLHITVLGLDTSDWSIIGVVPCYNKPGPLTPDILLPGRGLQIVVGTSEQVDATTSLKVFATTAPVDFGSFMLDELEPQSDPEWDPELEGGRGENATGHKPDEDFWRVYEGLVFEDGGWPIRDMEGENGNGKIQTFGWEDSVASCSVDDLFLHVEAKS